MVRPAYRIGEYQYDHLNRVVVKDYNSSMVLNEFNMRGFINHISARDQTGAQLGTFFDERIRYDWGFNSKQYNGNIAGIIWSYSNQEPQAYGYSYDLLDRLTHAEYRYDDGGTWKKNDKDYTASNITYDRNGNLLSMNQKAGIHSSGGVVQDHGRAELWL